MNPQLDKVETIFDRARQLPSPADQAEYLAAACGGDEQLRKRVETMLRDDARAQKFFESGAEAREEDAQLELEGSIRVAETRLEGPGTVIGRYKLLEKIGEGGMGVVYMAQQEEPVRRRVALKIIKLGMDTKQVVARFEAERQALALMDHPNIAKVLDGGATDTGRPYFVMELVQGVPITEFCDRNRFSARERIKLFILVCQAIQSAHQKGIIHRDLKPGNILVTLDGGVPMPMVIDFGVAKATQQKLTEKTVFTNYATMIGTPAYMSPEQAEMSRLDVDTRSDIYGLGVLLYELLTGTTPFPEKRLRNASYSEMQRIILEEEPERPSTRLNTLQGEQRSLVARNRGASELALGRVFADDLDWIVMKCLEKDRARRYETANGLAADLKRHLNNEPVVARPPSTAYRFQKLVRRNKLAFTAAGAVGVVLLLGIVVSTWQAVRARRAERQQSLLREKAVNAQAIAKAEAARAEQERNTARHNAYAASMLLAQTDWDNNNIAHLRQVLAETQDYPVRGFEWYYWQRLCHLEVRTFYGHLREVLDAALSADGQRLATASRDKTGTVWETSTGRELLTLEGHKAMLGSVAFSPNGQWIVTGSNDRTARVWDARTGREVRQLTTRTGVFAPATFSPDGQRIVTGSGDHTAKVWEAGSGKELLTLKGHSDGINSVAFSPDGQRIATGSADRTAKVWEAATGRELLTLKGHSDALSSVAFSPDGQRIVTGSWDNTAKVWETASGHELVTLKGHNNQILAVAFSPDGQRIVTGSTDRTARMWEAASGKELFAFKGHTDLIGAVAFYPDGRMILTGSADGTAKLWEVSTGLEQLTLRGHTHVVRSVAFSPNGQQILTGGDDQTAKVWEAATGRELLTFKGHTGDILSVGFSNDGQRVVTGSEDNSAKVWDARTSRVLFTLSGHRGWVRSVAFSADDRWIATGSRDRTAKLWDAATGKERHTLARHHGPILSVAFSPDGRWLVTGSGDSTAKVWGVTTGEELRTLKGHFGQILSVAFSPDGQLIVTGSESGPLEVWEASTGTNRLTLKGHNGAIFSATFSSDGSRIVTGSGDNTAKVWEVASGKELLTLKGHSNEVVSVAFSRDRQRIVTGSLDGTAKVWGGASPAQVAAWQEERSLAEKRLNTLRDERLKEEERQRAARASDEGAIKQWLVLAPVPRPAGETMEQGLERQQLPDEAQLRPRAGQNTLIDGKNFAWDEVHLADDMLDFGQLVGEGRNFSVAYAVCYIVADEEKAGLVMRMGWDWEAKVYLNGQQVFQRPYVSTFIPDDFEVRAIRLNQGLNVLVFKLVNERWVWQGSIHLTDKDGNPVKGIKVTLDPEGKDSR